MATLQDPNQDPNQPQGNPVNQPTTGGTSAPGTGQGGAQVNSSPVSPVSANSAPQAGAGYVDVSSYLNANPQGGQQLGNQIASNLTGTYNTTKGAIDTSAQGATASANAGYVPENTQLIQQVSSNPIEAANNPDNVTGFQGQLNDTYTGPSSWADMGTLQGKVSQAQQEAGLVNGPGGPNALVQNVENSLNPGQTNTGINTLDTLLYTGTPEAVKTVQDAAAPFTGLNDYINSKNTSISNTIAANQSAAALAQKDASAALNGNVTSLNTAVGNELTAAQQRADAYNKSLATNYPTAVANEQALLAAKQAALGPQSNPLGTIANNVGNPASYNAILPFVQSAYNSPIDKALGNARTWENAAPLSSAPNAGNVATSQDFATLAALQKLAGPNNAISSPLTAFDNSKAGTFAVPDQPTASLNDTNTLQYVNDLNALYGTPGATPFQNRTWVSPTQSAQYELASLSNNGLQNNKDYIAALNRILSGETGA